MGANCVGTYMCGDAQWAEWLITTGMTFYVNLYTACEKYGLKIIVAYYSNQSADWTSSSVIAAVTSQYQSLVGVAKGRPSTLMYMIGNEIAEKLSTPQQVAYFKWMGAMVDWTHSVDPNHPVMYADRSDSPALGYLKQYVPHLDVYGVNLYDFVDATSLASQMDRYATLFGKPVFLHEWGCDSFDVHANQEDYTAQASRIVGLARMVDTLPLGGCLFEWSDENQFIGSAAWFSASAFDGVANEAYWGLAKSVPAGKAKSRILKPAYSALKGYWTST